MSTHANISVWGREFYQNSDGYPRVVVEECLTEHAQKWREYHHPEKGGNILALRNEILLEYYENYEHSYGSQVDYSYDITDQGGELIVIVNGYSLENYNWEEECPHWEVIGDPAEGPVKLKLASDETLVLRRLKGLKV